MALTDADFTPHAAPSGVGLSNDDLIDLWGWEREHLAHAHDDCLRVQQFARWLPADVELTRVTRCEVEAWIDHLVDDGKSRSTVTGYRRILSGFYSWAVDGGALEVNPCDDVTVERFDEATGGVLLDDDATDEALALLISDLRRRIETEEPWQLDAACREHPELNWFPARGVNQTSISAIKAVCAECLVPDDCADYARRNHLNEGIWGAISGRGRREALRLVRP